MATTNTTNGTSPSTHQRRKITPQDITNLETLFTNANSKAELRTPSHPAYIDSIKRWSRAAEKPAGLAIVPTTVTDISLAVSYASRENLDLAVKGGGHSTAGASSTSGGLLIDLGGMRNVSVDAEKKLLTVQGGCLWGDVDDAAWKYGLSTVGGTAADTGVGGLTLGGGYGALSGTYGLVIDNLVSATVVLATGEIKHASKDENADLFWALRGAGQNFGVAADFTFLAYEQKDVYAGLLLYPANEENIRLIVETINTIFTVNKTTNTTKANGKLMSLLGFMRPPEPPNSPIMILIANVYDGPESEALQILKPYLDASPAINTMCTQPYPTVNKMFAPPIGLRSSMKGAAFVSPLRPQFVTEIFSRYQAFTTENADAKDTMLAWEMVDTTAITASEEGSFANRGRHFNALIAPLWRDEANDDAFRMWAREMSVAFKTELEKHGEEAGKGVDGGVGIRGGKGAVLLYGNYDQYDEKSKDIFGSNYERLQTLKGKYDPDNMFNKLFPITPVTGSNL